MSGLARATWLALVCASLAAWTGRSGAAAALQATLSPGVPLRGSIALDGPTTRLFTLALPDDVEAVDLSLACSAADLDLLAVPGAPIADVEAWPWVAATDEGEERLYVQRLSEPALTGGTLSVCISQGHGGPPLPDGDGGGELGATFTLLARVHRARVDAELEPGVPLLATLDGESGAFRTFVVDVPAAASVLRVDLFDASGDVDLFAQAGSRLFTAAGDVRVARHPWGAETLRIDLEPGAGGQRWFVAVQNEVDPTERTSFRIVTTFSQEAPLAVRGLPTFAPSPSSKGLARALPAVFELFCGPFSGSGTCVTPAGLLLTNAHVVDVEGAGDVVVCAPLHRGLPARESFRARVVELDRARDLALVQIERGFFDEPLPAGYRFPAAPLGDPDALEMGDGLWLVGYPSAGGQKSRVTQSVSRGIVSGFERGDFGLLIKTDAEIQGGSSGGAALDADGRLVGVPTSLVEIGSGQFGYVQPLSALPRAWSERLRALR